MSNTEKKQNNETENTETMETVEIVELDNVTGGCARCGCGNTGINPTAFATRAATWRR
jgi:hypothetical protein